MSHTPAILVIDVGLTNCKGIVYGHDAKVLSQESISYPTYQPESGRVEQSPAEWWQAAVTAVRRALHGRDGLAERIESISVTGHMHALVSLDKNGEALSPAIVLGDQRSVSSARFLTKEMSLETIYGITGARMEEAMPAAKIHWLRSQWPAIFRATHLFTGCKDYLRGRMTGDRLTEPVDACAMSLYDLQDGVWSEELLSLVGIASERLPEISSPTAIAGALCPDAARDLGLRSGIPVVVGSGDDVEVLGSGIMAPGKAKEHFGTTGSILTCTAEPVFDDTMSLELYPHVEPGLWVVGGSITSAGAALAWAADLLGYESLPGVFSDLEVGDLSGRGSLVFVPHLNGERCPRWNPLVRGTWVGLTNTHTKADLMRASFEGTAYALNSILRRIDSLVGKQQMVMVARRENDDPGWLSMRANAYGRPLGLLKSGEPTALGAMILGAVGVGIYENLHEAVAAVTGIDGKIEPDLAVQSLLAHRFDMYERVQSALNPVWESFHSPIAQTAGAGV